MRPRARMFRVTAVGEDAWAAMDAPQLIGKLHRRPLFLRIEVPDGADPAAHAGALMESKDERITNPEGPCGVVQISQHTWMFFGWYRPDADPIEDRKDRISLSELVGLEDAEDDEPVPGPELRDCESEEEDPTGDP